MKKKAARPGPLGDRGSALVIALVLLVILTMIGIYAVSVTVSEVEMANAVKNGKAAIDAAQAGAYTGIDALPVATIVTGVPLSNGATFDITPTSEGVESIPGYDTNWARVIFKVRSVGHPAPPAAGNRIIDAGVAYGPVPSGTGY